MARKPAVKKEAPKVDTAATDTTADTSAQTTTTETVAVEGAGVAWAANVAEQPVGVDFALLGSIVEATNGNSFVYISTDKSAELVSAGLAEINPGMVDDHGAVATRATAQGIEKMNEQTNTAGDPAANPQATPGADANAATGDAAATAAIATGDAGTTTTTTTDAGTATEAPKRVVSGIVAVPLPEKKRASSGGRTSEYDFDKLEVGQSFFVANSAKMPNAKKSLASTVSSATRRFATAKMDGDKPVTRKMKVGGVEKEVPVYDNTRVFELFAGKGDAYGDDFKGMDGAIIARTA